MAKLSFRTEKDLEGIKRAKKKAWNEQVEGGGMSDFPRDGVHIDVGRYWSDTGLSDYPLVSFTCGFTFGSDTHRNSLPEN